MGDTVSNIIARVGADVSPLSASMKEAQNTILTFKDASLEALKSFGLPHVSSTNLVEAIQSGQRVVVNFAKESGESLVQFQQRVRTVFAEAGIDITAYEKVLTDADKVHAEFAKGAVKNFQAVSAAVEEVNNKATDLQTSLGKSFSGINANIGAFKDSVTNAFKTLGDGSASTGEKFGAVSNAVVDGFGLMTGAVEIFVAVEVVKKVGEWINSLKELAAETQDAEHRFYASLGQMSDEAEQFSKKLSESYGIDQEAIQNMMGKEYMNTRMLGFDPNQAEGMSEHLTQLAYDLGKLRGIDPSQAFDALQRGIEGQTRGLMDLGIRLTTTDLKNRALSEGLIKQGQTMTDAQTSAVAYQMIMEKLQGTTGYYKSTADDLSTQQAKLNAGWDEMKRKLAESLTPAFTGLMRVVSYVAGGLELLVQDIAMGIQYISLFAEDAYSAVNDILNLNFGQINADWANNYTSIFNANDAAKQYGQSMDSSTGAANAQNAAQKALNKSVNANTMSFDQLHNLTNSGAAAAQGQTDAVNNLAGALGNLKNSGMNNIVNNPSKGIVIPIRFKVPPIPPIPPIPPPPPVVYPAVDEVSPVVSSIKIKLAELETSAVKVFGNVQTTISGWQTHAVTDFGLFATALSNDFKKGFKSASDSIHGWSVSASTDFSTFVTHANTAFSTFGTQFQSAWNQALSATETLVATWATRVERAFSSAVSSAMSSIASLASAAGQTLSNVGTSMGNWANQNKSWLAPLGVAAGAVGLTLATGGTDLIAGGIAAAGSALASLGAGFGAVALAGIGAMATGGVVTSPQVKLIGEAGPEAVIPLDRLDSMLSGASNPAGGNSNSASVQPINVSLQLDGRTLANIIRPYTVNEADRIGKVQGFDSSYNYPK